MIDLNPLTFISDSFPFVLQRGTNVVVLSDTELKEWKAKQNRREIKVLEDLVQSHYESIERLRGTIDSLKEQLTETETPESSTSGETETRQVGIQ